VPKNRRSVPREAKTEAILELAGAQLLEGGYRALSIGKISRALGVADNSIYWYFPSKDHLLVAVVRQLLDDLPLEKARPADTIEDVAVRALNRLADLQPVLGAVMDRSGASPVVADLEEEIRARLQTLAGHLAMAIGATDASAQTALAAAIDGLVRAPITRRQRGDALRLLIRGLSSS
jgi:AcrR family transcriptional regulator